MRATKLRVGWRLTVTLTEAVSTAHGLLLAGAEPLGAPLPSDAAIDWRPGVLMSLLPESWQVGSTWARAPATRASGIGMFWAPQLPAQPAVKQRKLPTRRDPGFGTADSQPNLSSVVAERESLHKMGSV